MTDGPVGVIEGTVTLNGTLPPPESLDVDPATAARPGCLVAARNLYAYRFGVNAPGPLPEALVTADARSMHPPPVRRRVITFHDCSIEPRFMVMSLNDQLWLHADTHEYHLPKVEGTGATIAQLLQPTEDQQKTIQRPGRYIVHSINYPNWMQTPLIATPNWFYDQTDRQGHFRIEHVPVGSVTVHAWYPGMTAVDRVVEVRAGAVAHQDFVLTAPSAPPPAADAGSPADAGVVPP